MLKTLQKGDHSLQCIPTHKLCNQVDIKKEGSLGKLYCIQELTQDDTTTLVIPKKYYISREKTLLNKPNKPS